MFELVTPKILKRIIATETRAVMLICVGPETGMKALKDTLGEVPGSGLKQIRICVVDVRYSDDRQELAGRFHVVGTPSIVFYQGGKERDSFLGQFNPEELSLFLEANLGRDNTPRGD